MFTYNSRPSWYVCKVPANLYLYMVNTNGAANVAAQSTTKKGKSRRGFAAMSPERQREIASQGGRAAHQKGTAHQFTSEEAAKAGRIGGLRSRSGGNRSSQSQSEEGNTNTTPRDNASFDGNR
jgi:general stress protein YciG